MAEKIEIDFEVVAKQAIKGIDDLNKRVDKLGKQTKKSSLILAGLGTIGIAGAIRGIGGAIKGMVDEAAKIETMTAKFTTLTGSVESAKDLVEDLTEFTAKTPFQLEGVANATKTLLAFGTSTRDVKPLLQDLGDISAAVGTPLNDLALIFGQVQAAGKLTGERYLQLAERGVVLKDVLAKELGVSASQVRDEISKGTITFDRFKQAITSLNDEGGLAAGGMARQAETLDGQLSTLSDNIKLMAARFGNVLLPAIKVATQAMTDFVTPVKEKTPLQQAKEELEALKREAETGFDTKATTSGFLGADVVPKAKAQTEQLIIAKQEEIARLEVLEKEAAERKKETDAAADAEAQARREEDERLKEETFIKGEEARYKKQLEANKRRQILQRKFMTESQRELDDWNKHQLTAEEKLQQNKGAIIAQGFNAVAAIAKEGGRESFGIWKAASLAEATIAGYLAIQKALASSPPPFNVIAASAVGALTALQIRGIAQTKPPAFQDGGIVGGTSFSGDNVTALVNSGEMILNRQQQAELFNQANGGGGNGVINAINRLGDRIANIEVVVMADDYEIGRSVNRAVSNGLVLGAAA